MERPSQEEIKAWRSQQGLPPIEQAAPTSPQDDGISGFFQGLGQRALDVVRDVRDAITPADPNIVLGRISAPGQLIETAGDMVNAASMPFEAAAEGLFQRSQRR